MQSILIADDDEFFRMALRAILRSELRFGEVVETASLDEAFERLAERDDISLALDPAPFLDTQDQPEVRHRRDR